MSHILDAGSSPSEEPAWLADYDYHLPSDRIARAPLDPRDSSRLLVLHRDSGELRHHRFSDLPDLLEPGDCLVVNETRVLRARLFTKLERTGRRVEVLLSHPYTQGMQSGSSSRLGSGEENERLPLSATRSLPPSTRLSAPAPNHLSVSTPGHLSSPARVNPPASMTDQPSAPRRDSAGVSDWVAILGRSRRLQEGDVLRLEEHPGCFRVIERIDRQRWRIRPDGDPFAMMEAAGHLPIPPYLQRDDLSQDRDWYQTVFASESGAVAAPTAGLHFTNRVLERARERGIELARIVLHVGPGTFLPVRAAIQEEHEVLPERYSISEDAARLIAETKARGGRVIAVGTTVVRALETAATISSASPGSTSPGAQEHPTRHARAQSPVLPAGSGWTDLTIVPGYRFRSIDGLVTNFHLPRSSLLLLVSAFAGREIVLAAYREAIERRYRFYSYGDAMLVL